MKKLLVFKASVVFLVLAGMFGFVIFEKKQSGQIGCTMEARICPDGSAVGRSGPNCEFAACPDSSPKVSLPDTSLKIKTSEFLSPIERAGERVTKKPFGIFIDPATSPVQPERFRGYHTGTDFETFPEEAMSDVPVRAICSGSLLVKRFATGYGGVVVESCTNKDEPITVVYGHMRLTSIKAAVGEKIAVGDVIGVLGTGRSQETDGERKHLHLGIHRGSAIDIRGYVASKQELGAWIDPCQLLGCSL